MPMSSRLVLAVLLVLPVLGAESLQCVGKVVGVSDGDTLSVMREGKAVKVRLYGIDTPERVSGESGGDRQMRRRTEEKTTAQRGRTNPSRQPIVA